MSHFRSKTWGRRLQAGDASVLVDVLRASGPRLKRELQAQFGGLLQDCEIDEALNTGLDSLWEHRTSFDPEKGAVENWYHAMVLNAARDILKFNKRRRCLGILVDPVRLDKSAPRDSASAPGPCAPDPQHRDRLGELVSILRELPEAQRYILLADANSREGKASSRELADELGLNVSTVRYYRWRGRNCVRRRIVERERERETKSSVRLDSKTGCRIGR